MIEIIILFKTKCPILFSQEYSMIQSSLQAEEIKQSEPQSLDIQHLSLHLNLETQSEQKVSYDAFFFGLPKTDGLKEHMLDELTKHGDIMAIEKGSSYFEIKIMHHSSNFQVIQFEVKINTLAFEILVYNSHSKSQTHYLRNISNSEAHIYVDDNLLKTAVVKCSHLDDDEQFSKSFLRIVKEFCIFKVASLLNIGPKLANIFGFDIIAYEDCIEFCMERCQPLSKVEEDSMDILKGKLRKLHLLQIVHLDIKPANICFSSSLNQLVFIDFGFSDFLDEVVGTKTKTTFIGTVGYSSPKMFNCYRNRSIQLVDIYYNDVYALTKSIEQIRSKSPQIQHPSSSLNMEQTISVAENPHFEKIEECFKLIFIKYCIFLNSPQLFNDISLIKFLSRFQMEIISLSLILPYSRYIQRIFESFKVNYFEESFNQHLKSKKSIDNFSFIHQNENSTYQDNFDSKFYPYLKGITIKRNYLSNQNVQEIIQVNLKDVVLNPKITSAADKEHYFYCFSKFTDFHTNISTFQQRLEAAKAMLKVIKYTYQCGVGDGVDLLAFSFKWLLNYYISMQNDICGETIPILLCNLTVINKLTFSEMMEFMRSIIDMKLTNTKIHALLIIRSKNAIIFEINAKINTKVDIFKRLPKFYQIIKAKLDQLASNTADKNAKIIKIISKLYEFNLRKQTSTAYYEQFEQTFSSLNLQIQSHLQRQIKAYHYSNQILHHLEFNQNELVIKYVEALNTLENKNNCKYIRFQYYHFVIYKFMLTCGNFSTLNLILKKLEACVGNKQLLQSYYIYNFKNKLQFVLNDVFLPKTYQLFLGYLEQSNDVLNREETLFIVDFLYKRYEAPFKVNDKKITEIMKAIHLKCKRKLSLAIISDFKFYRSEFETYPKHFFDNILRIVIVLTQIHKDNPQLIQTLDKFLMQLRQSWEAIPCICCKQYSSIFIVRIDGFILELKQNYTSAIELYKNYVQKQNIYIKYSKIDLLVKIIINLLKSDDYDDRVKQCITFIYGWVKKEDAWSQLLNFQRKQPFQVISRYLFGAKQYQQYMSIQLKLLNIIRLSPIDSSILIYFLQVVDFFFKFLVAKYQLFENLKVQTLDQFERNEYGAMFYAMFLIFLKQRDNWIIKRMIKFVCFKVNKLHLVAKQLTLGNLYYNLLIMNSNSQVKTRNHRLIKMQLKYFMKNAITRIQFDPFKKKLCHFKQKPSKIIKKLIIAHLRRYYDCLIAKSICWISKYSIYYPNPLLPIQYYDETNYWKIVSYVP